MFLNSKQWPQSSCSQGQANLKGILNCLVAPFWRAEISRHLNLGIYVTAPNPIARNSVLLKYHSHVETTQSIAEVHRGTYLSCVPSTPNVQWQPWVQQDTEQSQSLYRVCLLELSPPPNFYTMVYSWHY